MATAPLRARRLLSADGSRPCARLAVLAAAAALLSAAPVFAQPDAGPGGAAVVSASTRIDAWQLPSGRGGVASARAVGQQLALYGADPAQRIRGGVTLRYAYDAGLPARPSDPLLAARQLDPSLEDAWIAFRVFPALELQAGRFRADPFQWERIDGAVIRVQPGRTVGVELAAGFRPAEQTTTLDGDRSDRHAEAGLLTGLPEALLVGGLLRAGSSAISGFAAWAEERRPTRSQLLRRTLRGGARFGRGAGPSARLEAAVDALAWDLATASGAFRIPFGCGNALELNGRFDRPVFSLDSAFRAFDSDPGARAELRFERSSPRRAWLAGAGARVAPNPGALIHGSVRITTRRVGLDVRADAELGATRASGSGVALVRAPVSRRVTLEPSISVHTYHDPAARSGGDWQAVTRVAQGVRIAMGPHSFAWARADAGWDGAIGFSWRVVARVDVQLPVPRRQRGA